MALWIIVAEMLVMAAAIAVLVRQPDFDPRRPYSKSRWVPIIGVAAVAAVGLGFFLVFGTYLGRREQRFPPDFRIYGLALMDIGLVGIAGLRAWHFRVFLPSVRPK